MQVEKKEITEESEKEAEEAARARARRTEAVPSQTEVEEHSLDHAAFRSWCPHRVKRRAESYGHVKKVQSEGEAPTVGLDYVRTCSERTKEGERGMPIIVAKDNKTKMITARLAPSKGVDN